MVIYVEGQRGAEWMVRAVLPDGTKRAFEGEEGALISELGLE